MNKEQLMIALLKELKLTPNQVPLQTLGNISDLLFKWEIQIEKESKSNGTHISDMNIVELRETAKTLGLNSKSVSRKELYERVSDKLLEKSLAEFKQRRKYEKESSKKSS